MSNGKEHALAILCDNNNKIIELLHDNLGVSTQLKKGNYWTGLVDPESSAKAADFIKIIKTTGFALNWELNLSADNEFDTHNFLGVRLGNNYLVIVHRANVNDKVLEKMTGMTNELVNLNRTLSRKNFELQKARDEIKVLSGILPICMHCKEIRSDEGYWTRLENYITDHSEAQFSHSICEKCMEELYPDL